MFHPYSSLEYPLVVLYHIFWYLVSAARWDKRIIYHIAKTRYAPSSNNVKTEQIDQKYRITDEAITFPTNVATLSWSFNYLSRAGCWGLRAARPSVDRAATGLQPGPCSAPGTMPPPRHPRPCSCVWWHYCHSAAWTNTAIWQRNHHQYTFQTKASKQTHDLEVYPKNMRQNGINISHKLHPKQNYISPFSRRPHEIGGRHQAVTGSWQGSANVTSLQRTQHITSMDNG